MRAAVRAQVDRDDEFRFQRADDRLDANDAGGLKTARYSTPRSSGNRGLKRTASVVTS